MYTIKHYPGKHDQSSHGKDRGARGAYHGTYRNARAGGATIVEARQEARAASEKVTQAQREKHREEVKKRRDERREARQDKIQIPIMNAVMKKDSSVEFERIGLRLSLLEAHRKGLYADNELTYGFEKEPALMRDVFRKKQRDDTANLQDIPKGVRVDPYSERHPRDRFVRGRELSVIRDMQPKNARDAYEMGVNMFRSLHQQKVFTTNSKEDYINGAHMYGSAIANKLFPKKRLRQTTDTPSSIGRLTSSPVLKKGAITETTATGKIRGASLPYNDRFNNDVKGIGGRFNNDSKAWEVDPSRKDDLESLIQTHYPEIVAYRNNPRVPFEGDAKPDSFTLLNQNREATDHRVGLAIPQVGYNADFNAALKKANIGATYDKNTGWTVPAAYFEKYRDIVRKHYPYL